MSELSTEKFQDDFKSTSHAQRITHQKMKALFDKIQQLPSANLSDQEMMAQEYDLLTEMRGTVKNLIKLKNPDDTQHILDLIQDYMFPAILACAEHHNDGADLNALREKFANSADSIQRMMKEDLESFVQRNAKKLPGEAPPQAFTEEQLRVWDNELNRLKILDAGSIYSEEKLAEPLKDGLPILPRELVAIAADSFALLALTRGATLESALAPKSRQII